MSKYIRNGNEITNTETGEVKKFDSINKAKKESRYIQWDEGKRNLGNKNTSLGNSAGDIVGKIS